jgi:gamma-glutamyltranspeptidase/glutathione hydrolase
MYFSRSTPRLSGCAGRKDPGCTSLGSPAGEGVPERPQEARRCAPRNPGRLAAIFAGTLLLSACAGGGGDVRGPSAAFVGGLAVDEPRAGLAARDILAAGGSAADAASAAYFALAATLPSRASLGGSGACLVFDPVLGRVEAVDFMARPSSAGGGPVPLNARGFFVLQGRYGRLRWEQVVAPGEAIARFGVPMSRALARDVGENAGRIAASPDLSRLFRPGGVLLREGDRLVQPELAETLSTIRQRGANEFHAGAAGARFAAAARAAGAGFSAEEFAAAAPQFRAPLGVSVQDLRLSFLPPPAEAGILQAQVWQMIAPVWSQTPRDRRADAFLDAQLRATGDAARWGTMDLSDFGVVAEAISARRVQALLAAAPAPAPSPAAQAFSDSPAAVSIVAADRDGGAVACALTAGALFGAGRIAEGVILPAPEPRATATLAAVMAVRSLGGTFSLAQRVGTAQFVFAGGGSGPGAAAALVSTGVAILAERAGIDQVLDQPRVAVDGARLEAMPAAEAARGRLNVLACPGGLVDQPTGCRVRSDARGDGIAVGGVR